MSCYIAKKPKSLQPVHPVYDNDSSLWLSQWQKTSLNLDMHVAAFSVNDNIWRAFSYVYLLRTSSCCFSEYIIKYNILCKVFLINHFTDVVLKHYVLIMTLKSCAEV